MREARDEDDLLGHTDLLSSYRASGEAGFALFYTLYTVYSTYIACTLYSVQCTQPVCWTETQLSF
jgi:hypothetical protein